MRPSLGTTQPVVAELAVVAEHRCLFTHDLRRKAKRWQDGFLKFHAFNKRVMCYDASRNFIGDLHCQDANCNGLDDGDEFTLEAGVIVQVGELLGLTETDVSGLWKKKPTDAKSQQDNAPLPRATPLTARKINLAGATKGKQHVSLPRLSAAAMPPKSPYEQMHASDRTAAVSSTSASKRPRQDDEHVPLSKVLKRNHTSTAAQATFVESVKSHSKQTSLQRQNAHSSPTHRPHAPRNAVSTVTIDITSDSEDGQNIGQHRPIDKITSIRNNFATEQATVDTTSRSPNGIPTPLQQRKVDQAAPRRILSRCDNQRKEKSGSRERSVNEAISERFSLDDRPHNMSEPVPSVTRVRSHGANAQSPAENQVIEPASGDSVRFGADDAGTTEKIKNSKRPTTSLRLGEDTNRRRLLCQSVANEGSAICDDSRLLEPSARATEPRTRRVNPKWRNEEPGVFDRTVDACPKEPESVLDIIHRNSSSPAPEPNLNQPNFTLLSNAMTSKFQLQSVPAPRSKQHEVEHAKPVNALSEDTFISASIAQTPQMSIAPSPAVSNTSSKQAASGSFTDEAMGETTSAAQAVPETGPWSREAWDLFGFGSLGR